MKKINRYLDAAVLKPEFTREQAKKAIQQCIDYQTKTVCVRPCDIDLAVKMCKGSKTEVSCVLNFPHGTAPSKIKAYEARIYSDLGVNEIDMVVNYGFIKSGEWDWVEKDIRAVSEVIGERGIILKVIMEACYLTKEEIYKTTKIAINSGADFVKTSTGFATDGATVEAVSTMLDASAGEIKVKPAGGIRDYNKAKMFIDMGAERLGTNYTSNKAIIEDTENKSLDSY